MIQSIKKRITFPHCNVTSALHDCNGKTTCYLSLKCCPLHSLTFLTTIFRPPSNTANKTSGAAAQPHRAYLILGALKENFTVRRHKRHTNISWWQVLSAACLLHWKVICRKQVYSSEGKFFPKFWFQINVLVQNFFFHPLCIKANYFFFC